MSEKKLIPFSWLPAAWGLRGTSREIAQAEYELHGEELERKLAPLKYDGVELEIEELKIDHNYGKVTRLVFDKKLATLKGEPWVSILKTDYDPVDPLTGSLDIDWNDHFIRSLEAAGYTAPNDYEVVDMWLTDLCRNIATDMYGGVGTFDDDAQSVADNLREGS